MNLNEKRPLADEKAVRNGENSFLLEVLFCFLIFLSSSLLNVFLSSLSLFPDTTLIEIVYSENLSLVFTKGELFFALLMGPLTLLLSYVLLFLLRPSGLAPSLGAKARNLLPLVILSLFGVLAYIVLSIVLSGFGLGGLLVAFLSGALCTIYFILLYKLYLEGRTYSNALFWEIFRFAIVGLVAAVFDFLTCYLVQFLAFSGNEAVYVTIVSTTCGFLIGVVINYLMSTIMVYKNAKTKTSRTGKGILAFFLLSAVGLVIGIGIQAFLYDFLFLNKEILFLSYPVDFVIRTLIVMVYNYVTRKLFIYR